MRASWWRILTACSLALSSGVAVASEDDGEDTIDVDALVADDALLDALLYGEAEVPLENVPSGALEESRPPPPPSSPDGTHRPGFGKRAGLEAEPLENAQLPSTSKVSLWDWENRVSLGGGYKRNALFSAFSTEDSGFTLAEWESTLFRVSQDDPWQVFAYLIAENRHYADAQDLDNEWLVLALGQVDRSTGPWKFGLGVQYMYLDQAFSLEFEDLDLGATDVVLHQFQITPRLRYAVSDTVSLGLDLPLADNRFEDGSQDYEEYGIRGEAAVTLKNQGKISLSYGYEARHYDERTERTATGDSIVGEELEWNEHAMELAIDLPLDAQRHWRSKTRFRYRLVEDEGSGYHDFAMAKLSQALRYQKDPWGISLTGSYSHYDYPVQTKATGDTNMRHRSLFGLSYEMKRSFLEAWEAFGRYEFESYLSNVPEDDYDVHVFSLGLRYTF